MYLNTNILSFYLDDFSRLNNKVPVKSDSYGIKENVANFNMIMPYVF